MPNKYGTITFVLGDLIKQRIEDLASRRQVSQGAICKMAITKYLEEEGYEVKENESAQLDNTA